MLRMGRIAFKSGNTFVECGILQAEADELAVAALPIE